MFVVGAVPDELRQRVLSGAAAELLHWGAERFSIENLAADVDVDPAEIRRHWCDENAVIADMLSEYGAAQIEIPDTGTLYGDFLAYASAVAEHIQTPMGRKLMRSMVISGDGWQIADGRSAFWSERQTRLSVMAQRAADRGELRDGIDIHETSTFLLAPLYMRVLYTEDAISTEFCERVAEAAWRAFSSAADR